MHIPQPEVLNLVPLLKNMKNKKLHHINNEKEKNISLKYRYCKSGRRKCVFVSDIFRSEPFTILTTSVQLSN